MAEYTRLNRADIAASAFGTSPRGIRAFEDLQQAALDDGPAATETAQRTADGAQAAADTAQSSADTAQSSANAAQTTADQGVADAAAALAEAQKKVAQSAGPVFAAATGALSRAAYASYIAPTISATPTQAEVQGVADAVQALSRVVVALITDLRANKSLTP